MNNFDLRIGSQEKSRVHPPGPGTIQRVTPAGGNIVLGKFLPRGHDSGSAPDVIIPFTEQLLEPGHIRSGAQAG